MSKLNREKITAFVTKYALTQGIMEVEGEVCHDVNSNMFAYGKYGHAHGNDWYRNREDAIKKADEMKKKKIVSLQKSISKLESMTF